MSTRQNGISSEKIISELRRQNFQNLLKIDFSPIEKYSHKEYIKNKKHQVIGFCKICEDKGCNLALDNEKFKLSTISHGTHSNDYFETAFSKNDVTKWNNTPLMFVFESPSINNPEWYYNLEYNGVTKSPPKFWYWIEDIDKYCEYPLGFKGKM